jgi:hypothetical protein
MAAQEATDVRRILAHVENNAKPLRMGSFLKSDEAASNDFRTTQLAFTGSLAAAVLGRYFVML